MTRKGKIFLAVAGVGLAVVAAMAAFLFNREDDAKRRRAAATFETNAVQHLKDIAACQLNHLQSLGEYATLPKLFETCTLVDERFNSEAPVVDGYRYTISLTPRAGDRPPAYAVNADPQPPPGTYGGRLHFYADSEVSGIRVNDSRPATASDRQRE